MIKHLSLLIAVFGMNLLLTKPTSIAIAQDTPAEPVEVEVRERHQIKVSVSSPADIKVAEGDRIEIGQVIAERTDERIKLQSKRDELALAIAQLQEPLQIPPKPPEPSFAPEESAVSTAQLNLAYWKDYRMPEFRFVEENMIQVHDAEILEERQQIALNRLNAQTSVNEAIANLQEAKNQHQYQLYQYQLTILETEQRQRERTLEVLRLGSRLDDLDQQLDQLTAVRSPYSGRIRKVDIINQSDLTINAEITVLVATSEESETSEAVQEERSPVTN